MKHTPYDIMAYMLISILILVVIFSGTGGIIRLFNPDLAKTLVILEWFDFMDTIIVGIFGYMMGKGMKDREHKL